MKFETINGTLCRMVEPEPLQLDSPMPCVVRYIQDCSPMGRYLKRKYAMVINTVAIVSRFGADGRAYSSDKIFVEEVEVLEIFGYPVEDGSHYWALYQMMQGKKVCHKSYTMKTTHCAINDESQVVIFTTPYSVANGGDVVCHADEWLDHRQYGCGVDERTGWQLYKEPKPEPKPEHPAINGYNRYDYIPVEGIRQPKPAFKVGDWVEYSDGTLQQAIIEAYSGQPGEQMVYVWHPQTAHSAKTPLQSIARKLDPSEVVLDFGNGIKGRVCMPYPERGLSVLNDNNHWIAQIDPDALDAPMRKLVESLLKAQEEK